MVLTGYLELYLKPIFWRNNFTEININDMLKSHKIREIGV